MASRYRTSSVLSVAGAVFALLTPSAVAAQTVPERVALSANGTYQGGASSVSSTVALTANSESGSFSSAFRVKAGPGLDVSGRVRIFRNVSLGVGYTSFTANGTADVNGQIPHPFYFNRARTIAGQASLTHAETAVHVRLVIASAPGKKLQFTAFAGPVFFSMKQGLVDSVSYTDAYPFDTATFKSAVTREASQSKTALGGGVDVAYYFTKNIGIGVMASVATATFSLAASDSSAVSVSAGGTTFGGGLRVRF